MFLRTIATKNILIPLFILFSINKIYAQNNNWASYFPLKVGNAWYYKTTFYIPFPPIYHKSYIEKDTLINGVKYFFLRQRIGDVWTRIDSLSGNLLAYSPGSGCGSYIDDKILDSLASNINDMIFCDYQGYSSRRCLDTGATQIFNISSAYKEFKRDGLTFMETTYAKNFGVVGYCAGEPPPTCYETTALLGCRINGIVYGDTNLVNIKQASSAIPSMYKLYQNFPNPFNPVTKIKFDVPSDVRRETRYVRLIVFDIVGKEITFLVNQQLNAGSYSVEFNAGNYPSGIYYYKLEAGDFSEAKKMILLK